MGFTEEFHLLKNVRSVGFFGLGKSNLAILRLIPKNSAVTLRSEGHIDLSALPKRLRNARIFEEKNAFDVINEDILFLSPSARRERPEFEKARAEGVKLCSDFELFLSEFSGISFAVSGSDGKSTTATLASLLLNEKFNGISAIGNIGIPFCHSAHASAAVLELSSFNLRYSTPHAKRAAITNITPNHLNWHSDFEEYKETKLSLLDSADEAVISADDEILSSYAQGRRIFAVTSVTKSFEELKRKFHAESYFTAEGGFLLKCGEPIIPISKIKRKEEHNLKNLLTAAALADGYTTHEHFSQVAENFHGLAHRCEEICTSNGVRYINSSIDTTPSRTAQTLSSLDKSIILILGGRTKGCDPTPLREPISKKVRLAVITGECRQELADRLRGCCDIAVIDGFEESVLYAASVADAGDTVLLSPAATSYDAFSSFEERGEKFKKIIEEFKNTRSK